MARITRKQTKLIQEDIKSTKYMDPQEAIAYGIAYHCCVVLPSEMRVSPYLATDKTINQPEQKRTRKKEKEDATKDTTTKRRK
jgi:hypothetical protein